MKQAGKKENKTGGLLARGASKRERDTHTHTHSQTERVCVSYRKGKENGNRH